MTAAVTKKNRTDVQLAAQQQSLCPHFHGIATHPKGYPLRAGRCSEGDSCYRRHGPRKLLDGVEEQRRGVWLRTRPPTDAEFRRYFEGDRCEGEVSVSCPAASATGPDTRSIQLRPGSWGHLERTARTGPEADDGWVQVDKNDVRRLPRLVKPDMTIEVVDTVQAVPEAVQRLRARVSEGNSRAGYDVDGQPINVLGLDTETKPTRQKGQKGNKTALLQLCTAGTPSGGRAPHCALFRLPEIWGTKVSYDVGRSLVQPLVDLLADEDILKVGVGIVADVKGLVRDYPEFKACLDGAFLELGPPSPNAAYRGPLMTRWPQMTAYGLRRATASILKRRLCKKQQQSEWERWRLCHAQRTYAALDAWVATALLRSILGGTPAEEVPQQRQPQLRQPQRQRQRQQQQQQQRRRRQQQRQPQQQRRRQQRRGGGGRGGRRGGAG